MKERTVEENKKMLAVQRHIEIVLKNLMMDIGKATDFNMPLEICFEFIQIVLDELKEEGEGINEHVKNLSAEELEKVLKEYQKALEKNEIIKTVH